jgi:hypothetical protein
MEIEAVREVDFVADASLGEGTLAATISGNADLNVRLALDRFLTALHREARLHGVREVTFDVRELDFMNSSCLKSLVSWVTQIQDLPRGQQYHVTFLSSPRLYWQKRSLHALSCLAQDIITVQA